MCQESIPFGREGGGESKPLDIPSGKFYVDLPSISFMPRGSWPTFLPCPVRVWLLHSQSQLTLNTRNQVAPGNPPAPPLLLIYLTASWGLPAPENHRRPFSRRDPGKTLKLSIKGDHGVSLPPPAPNRALQG